MTQDEIVELAIQGHASTRDAIRWAIKQEHEACAKVCEEYVKSFGGIAEGPFVTDFGKHTHMSMAAGASNCESAIRARNKND